MHHDSCPLCNMLMLAFFEPSLRPLTPLSLFGPVCVLSIARSLTPPLVVHECTHVERLRFMKHQIYIYRLLLAVLSSP